MLQRYFCCGDSVTTRFLFHKFTNADNNNRAGVEKVCVFGMLSGERAPSSLVPTEIGTGPNPERTPRGPAGESGFVERSRGGGEMLKTVDITQVVATFQRMRQEQRSMASKSAEFEMDINEHSLVIDTLKEVDPSRKCFRLVGGVLLERTVKEVLPALENNKEQILKIVESINTQMQAKGRELTEYRERYNIRLVGEDDKQGKADASQAKESEGGGSKGGTGVLVS